MVRRRSKRGDQTYLNYQHSLLDCRFVHQASNYDGPNAVTSTMEAGPSPS